jgi:RNase P/RNase MRP subunit p30
MGLPCCIVTAYRDDMSVDRILVEEMAVKIVGIEFRVKNELEHNALRAEAGEMLYSLLRQLRKDA